MELVVPAGQGTFRPAFFLCWDSSWKRPVRNIYGEHRQLPYYAAVKKLAISGMLLLVVSGSIAQTTERAEVTKSGGKIRTLAASTGASAVKFSIYAVAQKDAPLLRIVGLKYNFDEIQLVLANNTNKTVTGAEIEGRITAPRGCSVVEPMTGVLASGPDLKNVHINPRQELTVKPSPLGLAALVWAAQYEKAAGAQVQVEVTEIDFADGTSWRLDPDPRLPTGHPTAPFVPSLLEADAGMCSSPTKVVEALLNVNGTGSRDGMTPLEGSTVIVEGETIPHIVFECTLEGPSASCTMSH